MRISDWTDVCSSDLLGAGKHRGRLRRAAIDVARRQRKGRRMFAALTARLRGAHAECCTTPLRIKKFFHRLHPAGNEKARQHSNAKRAHAPFSETCWRPGTPRLQAGSKSAPRNGKTKRLREQAMPRHGAACRQR